MKDDNDTLLLKDPSFLMVLLAALCKKNGGSLRFSEEDVASVTSIDALGLYQDPENEDVFILKLVDPEDYKKYMADKKQSNYKQPKKKRASSFSKLPAYRNDKDDEEWEN